MSQFMISQVMYIYEHDYCYPNEANGKKFYNKGYSKIRELRNDASHRCSVYSMNEKEIFEKYEKMLENEALSRLSDENYSRSRADKATQTKYDVIKFLDENNYESVREMIREMLSVVVNKSNQERLVNIN